MIGIDIIDRSCSFRNSKHSLEQCKSKILNEVEYSFCSGWNELDLLWAIKESAYKNHYKKTGSYFVNPKKITVLNMDYAGCKFSVAVEDSFYSGFFVNHSEYVYAVCGIDIPTKLILHKINSKQPSPFKIPHYLNNSVVEYHPDGFAEFVVYKATKYAYSRSHHGNYYISAMCPFWDN